jgi:UrcA family protein
MIHRVAALALTFAAIALPAQADQCGGQTAERYKIHYSHLDLSQPSDRQALLTRLDRSVKTMCECGRSSDVRAACEADVSATALRTAPSSVQSAIQTARLERRKQMQAQN